MSPSLKERILERRARIHASTPVQAGTQAAAWIDRQILTPLESALPAAAPLVERVRRCGGCKADTARLNGDGGGSII